MNVKIKRGLTNLLCSQVSLNYGCNPVKPPTLCPTVTPCCAVQPALTSITASTDCFGVMVTGTGDSAVGGGTSVVTSTTWLCLNQIKSKGKFIRFIQKLYLPA